MKIKRDTSLEGLGEVQMGPLIDCVFLLLIFFLVTATMQKPHKELDLQLPHSAAAKEAASNFETLIFQISKDGEIYYDNQLLTKGTLHKTIREAAKANNQREVRLDADRRCAAQHLVYLLDLLQFEGLNKVAIRARD
jgi:biopolymer transport protein ExbD